MIRKTLIAIALLATAANLYYNYASTNTVSNVEEQFKTFIMNERRSYFSKDEYSFRLGVFSENLKKVEELNANPNDEAVYAINQFSDKTQEEFEALLGLKNLPLPRFESVEVDETVNDN